VHVTPNPDALSCVPLDITVILCTYNRCRDLVGALENIAASQMPTSVTWEVLVVDNNSTDQTREVVQGFDRRYPGRFRYLFDPNPGKSHALNTGIANARGEVLAFVDDDVTMEPTWLHNLTAELHDGTWAGAGGRILPAEGFTPPPWLPESEFPILCAHFDLGDQPSSLDRPPYGTNMAFRKSVFEKHGGFRIDLGPRPNSQIRNEDTELGRRLLAAGERLRYEPSAVVYHSIPPGRVTQRYFFSCWFDFGRAMIREYGERPDVYGIPRDYLSMLRCAMEIAVMTLRWMFAIHPQKRFRYKCQVRRWAGQMVELYRRSIGRKRSNAAGAQEPRSKIAS
jgi:glycosyltransferase involved in cell wall biosynthesis